ncbi:hypothetical protein SB758_35475, partial [Burkholderia sp. SIMBA_013]
IEVVLALVKHIEPVLRDQGELEAMETLLFQMLVRGTGATRQREIFSTSGSLTDVIADAVALSSLPCAALEELGQEGPSKSTV